MSNDIVKRLRSWRHDSWPSDPSFDAAAEIERLSARVEVLERVCTAAQLLIDRWSQSERSDWYCGIADLRAQKPHFRWYADQKQAAQRDYDDARAALEAQP